MPIRRDAINDCWCVNDQAPTLDRAFTLCHATVFCDDSQLLGCDTYLALYNAPYVFKCFGIRGYSTGFC